MNPTPTPPSGESGMKSVTGRTAGRWFVWVWLAVVVLTLIGMQAFLFGTKGLPKFVRAWFGETPASNTAPKP